MIAAGKILISKSETNLLDTNAAMPWLLYGGWITIILLFLTFVVTRSRLKLFAIIGQMEILCFWLLTHGLATSSIADFYFILLGAELFWAGLLIVRIMLKRSVSLQLLIHEFTQSGNYSSSPWIAERLRDAIQWDLVSISTERYALTKKGKIIALLVGSLHLILRNEE